MKKLLAITNKCGTRKLPHVFVENIAQALFEEGTVFGFVLSNVIWAVLFDKPDILRALCSSKFVEIYCGRIVVRSGKLEAGITVSEDGTFVKVLEDEEENEEVADGERWARVVSEFRF